MKNCFVFLIIFSFTLKNNCAEKKVKECLASLNEISELGTLAAKTTNCDERWQNTIYKLIRTYFKEKREELSGLNKAMMKAKVEKEILEDLAEELIRVNEFERSNIQAYLQEKVHDYVEWEFMVFSPIRSNNNNRSFCN